MKETSLSEANMELLAELEHVRWSRYHYVNHWNYGMPEEMPLRENGKRMAKNSERRLHTGLIPYAALSKEVQDKDKDAIREMFDERAE